MSGSGQKQKLQLTLHATDLKNVAGRGKGTSDPYAEVKLIASGSDEDPGILLGRTESIKNSLYSKWTTTFLIDDNLGKDACIKVIVADKIRKESDKFIGCKYNMCICNHHCESTHYICPLALAHTHS